MNLLSFSPLPVFLLPAARSPSSLCSMAGTRTICLLFAWGFFWVRSGMAESRALPVTVRVQPPNAACISGAELGAIAADWAKDNGLSAPSSEILVQILRRSGGGWSAQIGITNGSGKSDSSRHIETPNPACHDLDAALALVMEVLLESTLTPQRSATTAPEPVQEISSSPQGPRPLSEEVPSSATSDHSRAAQRSSGPPHIDSTRTTFTLGGELAVGIFRDPVLAARVAARVPLRSSFGLRFGVAFTPRSSRVSVETAQVRFSLATARVSGCMSPLERAGGFLDACAGLDAGVVTANSQNLTGSARTVRWSARALAELSAGAWLAENLLVETRVSGGPLLTRDQYWLTNLEGRRQQVQSASQSFFELGLHVGFAL